MEFFECLRFWCLVCGVVTLCSHDLTTPYSSLLLQGQLALITKFVNAARYCCEIRNYSTCMQILDALEMFVVRHLPVSSQTNINTRRYMYFSMFGKA